MSTQRIINVKNSLKQMKKKRLKYKKRLQSFIKNKTNKKQINNLQKKIETLKSKEYDLSEELKKWELFNPCPKCKGDLNHLQSSEFDNCDCPDEDDYYDYEDEYNDNYNEDLNEESYNEDNNPYDMSETEIECNLF